MGPPRRIWPPPCRVELPTRRGSASKAPKQPKREPKKRAMSRWTSNATWLHLKSAKTTQKGAKRVRHVALGPRHVALDLQRDVAPPPRRQNSPKGSKKSAPRRIGSPPCRVEPPTRRGSSSKGPKLPKKEQKERATSYWEPAMSRWASNTTWLELQGSKSAQKRVKRVRHVALVARHDALDLQRDVAPQLQTPSY